MIETRIGETSTLLDTTLRKAEKLELSLRADFRQLESWVCGWMPAPWQSCQPGAANNDTLLRSIPEVLAVLGAALRDLRRHLHHAANSRSEAEEARLQSRLGAWKKLLGYCRANDIQAFIKFTGANAWIAKECPPVASKRALVSGGPESDRAWVKYREKAKRRADEHAFAGTPEWKKTYQHLISLGGRLESIVGPIQSNIARCRLAIEAQSSVVRKAASERVMREDASICSRLEESTKEAVALRALARAVKAREQEARGALEEPGVAVLEKVGFTIRPSPLLNDHDDELALLWADEAGGDPYRVEQMRSARRAEVAAVQVYRLLYGEATDLSIGQLRGDVDTGWRSADICSDGRWIDVKNARRSLASPDTYSEHCVPRFKRDRHGKEVSISAFLSPYHAGTGAGIVWLGETSQAEISQLEESFGSAHLSVQSLGAESMLPPWLFDFPPAFYAARDEALARLRVEDYEFPLCGCHPALAILARGAETVLVSSKTLPIVVSSTSRTTETLELAKRIASVPAVRRSTIFLHVLDRFCRSLLEGRDFPEGDLRWLLFPPIRSLRGEGPDNRLPLLQCDPLQTVSTLLSVLEVASRTCRNRALGFSEFRLRGAGLLQGRARAGGWQTIVAYCGGWDRLFNSGRVRCGQNPLFLGQDEPCRRCGRLICHRCGFCSKDCPDCSPRQERWPEEYGT